MLLYIAGPMRGIKYYNFPAFDQAKEELWDLCYEVLSPADMDREMGNDPFTLPEDHDWNTIPDGFDFGKCVRKDVEAITCCDGIYLLKGWENSKGAKAEKTVAEWMGKEVMYQFPPTQSKVHATLSELRDNLSASRTSVKETNPKDAIGALKAKFSTIPTGVTLEVGLALLEGAVKYGRHNYRGVGVRSSVYYDAAMGHMADWWEGEDVDPDSGLSHIIKSIASLYVLRDAILQDKLEDDRPPRSNVFKRHLNAKAKSIIEMHKDKNPKHWTIETEVK